MQMLTRLYIDNYRCFEKFEYRPARRQLILGGNGTGKSSMMSALVLLRRVAYRGDLLDDALGRSLETTQRTRWLDQTGQTFELSAELAGVQYTYKLFIDGRDSRGVVRESVHVDGKAILEVP